MYITLTIESLRGIERERKRKREIERRVIIRNAVPLANHSSGYPLLSSYQSATK